MLRARSARASSLPALLPPLPAPALAAGLPALSPLLCGVVVLVVLCVVVGGVVSGHSNLFPASLCHSLVLHQDSEQLSYCVVRLYILTKQIHVILLA